MRRLPPLRALEAFVRTVRLGSARSAASELGLSPSALSRRIANLEEFTGRKLFSRSGQAMKLTDEGRHFYDIVAPHLEALAVAVETQSENLQLLRLRLGVLPLFGTQRLFPKLPELRALSDPVVGHPNPESLFTDSNRTLHRNKQAALHIQRELLKCGMWSRAGEWLTDKYIQHNPVAASGLEGVINYFVTSPSSSRWIRARRSARTIRTRWWRSSPRVTT